MAPTLPDLSHHLVDEGRIQLLEVLGAGSFGIVYRARDTTAPEDKQVYFAVKCLGFLTAKGTEKPGDTLEIALHKACSHHHSVITLHRSFHAYGCVFLVLELASGGHLLQAIARGVFYNDSARVKATFIQILDAIATCHQHDICHRDLKPENILCNTNGTRIRIADFGLAVRDDAYPRPISVGSLAYMTPGMPCHHLGRTEYEPRQSDIWAACIVLLNMMTPGGLCPWAVAHKSDGGWCAFIEDPTYLRRRFPISQALDGLLSRCFNPSRTGRPSLARLREEILHMPELFTSASDERLPPPPMLEGTESALRNSGLSFSFRESAYSTPATSYGVELPEGYVSELPVVSPPTGKPAPRSPLKQLRQWMKQARRAQR
ncbi:kinase-like domain-containing protein [Mycena polygramma]|nr:kinase-like domain-containing protein [Mycena polygramma]